MTDKSHVGIGVEVCPVCGKEHDETVLLDRRLRNSLASKNLTGRSLCPEHEAMRAEYLALVETEAPATAKTLKPADARPTGRFAHVRRGVAARIFNVEIPDNVPFIYVEPGVIEKLESLQERAPA